MSVTTDDFSRRQVLPQSAAVRGVPFTDSHHERARIIREANDLFDLDRCLPLCTPSRELQTDCEAIELSGYVVRRSLTTAGGNVVRQQFTADLAPAEALALLEAAPAPPLEFIDRDPSLRVEAARALERMSTRKQPARRRADPAPSPGHSWPRLVAALVAIVVVSIVVIRVLS